MLITDKNCVTITKSVPRLDFALDPDVGKLIKSVRDELAVGIAASDLVEVTLTDNLSENSVVLKASVAVLAIYEYEYLKSCEKRLKELTDEKELVL